MSRYFLAIGSLAIVALACSFGGSDTSEQESPEEGSSGGVPIAKSTSAPVEQVAAPTATLPEATQIPQPTVPPTEGSSGSEPSQGDAIIAVDHLGIRASVGTPVVFGLVKNIGGEILGGVTFSVVFFDDQQNVIDVREGYAHFKPIPPGMESPFEIYLYEGVPENTADIGIGAELKPDYGTASYEREGFEFEGIESGWGDFGYVVEGTVRNTHSRHARKVSVALAFYNASDELIGLYINYIDEVQPGGTDYFRWTVVESYFTFPDEIDHFEFLYEGNMRDD